MLALISPPLPISRYLLPEICAFGVTERKRLLLWCGALLTGKKPALCSLAPGKGARRKEIWGSITCSASEVLHHSQIPYTIN